MCFARLKGSDSSQNYSFLAMYKNKKELGIQVKNTSSFIFSYFFIGIYDYLKLNDYLFIQ